MHCKHCGNKIENDSKFCSFCGGKVESIVQTSSSQENLKNHPYYKSENGNDILQNQVNSDKGLIVAFSIIVGSKLLWMILDFINKNKTYEEVESYNNFILKPSFLVFWSVPLILAYFSKRNEMRTILLIISLAILGVAIYDNFIYSI